MRAGTGVSLLTRSWGPLPAVLLNKLQVTHSLSKYGAPGTYFIQGENTEKVPQTTPHGTLLQVGVEQVGTELPNSLRSSCGRECPWARRVPVALPGSQVGKESRKRIHCSNLILLKRKHTKIMYKKN